MLLHLQGLRHRRVARGLHLCRQEWRLRQAVRVLLRGHLALNDRGHELLLPEL
jgi:hypothetical protein